MPLRPVHDLAVADWFVVGPGSHWDRILMGPDVFEAYARVHFDLDGDSPTYTDDDGVLDQVRQVLASHTTSSEGLFGFWEGSGCLEGHPVEPLVTGPPRLHVRYWRSYFLLTGDLDDPGAWSSASALHLAWPADRAWFLAADVDPDWIGVGGTQDLVDELVAHPKLDAVPSTHDASDWETR